MSRLATLLTTAVALTFVSDAPAQPAPVLFDRFEYVGRDPVFEQPLPAGHYRTPILTGFYPDPSICRVGEDYYLISSTFAFFPGIPIFHSRDLVNWRQIGHVVHRPDQLKFDNLGATRGIFAPAISHHDGTFYVVCTMVDGGGNFLMTAKDPAGPWSDPVWLPFEGIDPSLFFDGGKAWMLNNGAPEGRPLYDGHRAIWIQEFDLAAKKLVGPRQVLVNGGVDITKKPVWIEGPHLYKRGEWYYLCCAEGGTSTNHSQVIYRSKAPTGPFVAWDKNPILTQRDLDGNAPHAITCTGHADLEIGPDGNWWTIFLACRPYAPDRWATGRETFLLPVKWTDDGWPLILPPGERVPYTQPAPTMKTAAPLPPADPAKPAVLTGNFTWRDEFDAPALSPFWIMLRAPQETWWNLAAPAGSLALTPRAETLNGKGNPAFLGRRVQHSRYEAAVTLQVPTDSRVTAGLAAFQSETQNFFFGVRRNGDWMSVFLERWHEGRRQLLANQVVAAAAQVELRLTGHDTKYTFSFAPAGGAAQVLLKDTDSYPVSVQAAGGGVHFTGLVVGPHARVDR
jgi:xylan 1,4-beta-xylosidase